MSDSIASRYVHWIERHRLRVIAVSLVLAAGAAALAGTTLKIATDLASLLPADAQAVRDMRELERRVPAQGNIVTLVIADDADVRQGVVDDLVERYEAIGSDLVGRVEADDQEVRAFAREHLYLFVPSGDLQQARDALRDEIRAQKLAANPLYIDLEDDPDVAEDAGDPLVEIKEKRDEALATLERNNFVSQDGRIHLVVIRAAFAKTNVGKAEELARRIDAIRTEVLAVPGREGVEVGSGGAVLDAVVERDAIVRSMSLAVAITAILVFLLLVLFYRSATLVVMLTAALVAGVAVTFGVTALVIGHLNVATSFLVAIVAGNGVNYGLLMLARYAEERSRRGRSPREALIAALPGTLRPTLVACLGAMIAYGSLAVTSFRGFSEFAIIGSVGMALCWVAAFTLLPALVLTFDRRPVAPVQGRRTGEVLARIFGSLSPVATYGLAVLLAAGSLAVAYQYVVNDPFEYDVKKLRSSHEDPSKRYKDLSDEIFGKAAAGSSTFIATDSVEQVPLVIDALEAIDRERTESSEVFGRIISVEDVIPRQQDRKIELLRDIREMLDGEALDAVDDDRRQLLEELRPPDRLERVVRDALPASVVASLSERDGSFGRLISVRPADRLEMWNGKDLIEFASAIRSLELSDGSVVTTSGSSVIFADIVDAIRRDAPIAAATAAFAIAIMVVFVVGLNRMAVGVLLSTILGSAVMVATVALMGMKVNFLDFVALPITIGLGVDYGINIAHRGYHGQNQASNQDRYAALRTSGVAVLIASGTTVIAYGSLLVSANSAVRSFGLASLIGEVCCVVTAMALVPLFATSRRA